MYADAHIGCIDGGCRQCAWKPAVFGRSRLRPFSMPSRKVRESAVLDGWFPRFRGNPRLWVMAHKTAKTAVRIHIRIIPFRSDSSGKRAKRERRRPAGFVSCGASPVFNRLSVAMSTGVDMRSRFSDACENRLRVVQALDVIILRSGVQLVQDGGFLRGILPGLGEHTGFVSCNIGGGVPFA